MGEEAILSTSKGIISICLIFIVVFSSGCTQQSSSQLQQVTKAPSSTEAATVPSEITKTSGDIKKATGSIPETEAPAISKSLPLKITNFVIYEDGGILKARFSLMDEKLAYTQDGGHADFRIEDSSGKVVYTSSFDVRKVDFGDYVLQLTGQPFNAYVWEIPVSKVKKSFSPTGNAYLKFKTAIWEFPELKESVFGLPTYTDEEITKIDNDAFLETATTFDKTITSENLEITLIRYGSYNFHQYGDKKGAFRVDLKVKNTGGGKTSISYYDSVIITQSNKQYEKSYDGLLTSGDLQPGVISEGFLLFDEVPKTEQIKKIMVGNDYIFDIEKGGAYTIAEMYENRYLQSAISVEKTKSAGDFSVRIDKIGRYSTQTYGGEKRYFRIDLEVTNIASKEEYFFDSDISLIDNLGNQYERQYGGTFDSGKMMPGVKRSGYILFTDLNDRASNIKIMIEAGHDAKYDPIYITFDVPLVS